MQRFYKLRLLTFLVFFPDEARATNNSLATNVQEKNTTIWKIIVLETNLENYYSLDENGARQDISLNYPRECSFTPYIYLSSGAVLKDKFYIFGGNCDSRKVLSLIRTIIMRNLDC
jgi:hypothetical protein